MVNKTFTNFVSALPNVMMVFQNLVYFVQFFSDSQSKEAHSQLCTVIMFKLSVVYTIFKKHSIQPASPNSTCHGNYLDFLRQRMMRITKDLL